MHVQHSEEREHMTKNIETFEAILYLVPLPEPVGTATSGVMSEFEVVMVHISKCMALVLAPILNILSKFVMDLLPHLIDPATG